ncbi:MAG: DUF1127 domain-containing protein [Marivita sp.]|uniref:DUF1127 domain-containing protein n=1 Tax=Marivita sp. TaxID=2003365 RepID=UPI0025C6D036|nr:DUF1127 domain-containing protein [Marivita sp.]MCI5111654.1 DUF1127 domain-containing protein [Marivita sp.]
MAYYIDSVRGHGRASARRPLLARIATAFALHRSRARLATLDAHLLDDIGVDAGAAQAEARRPIWDAPDFWRG